MPVSLTCPDCGKKLKAPDKAVGCVVACSRCRTKIKIEPPRIEEPKPVPAVAIPVAKALPTVTGSKMGRLQDDEPLAIHSFDRVSSIEAKHSQKKKHILLRDIADTKIGASAVRIIVAVVAILLILAGISNYLEAKRREDRERQQIIQELYETEMKGREASQLLGEASRRLDMRAAEIDAYNARVRTGYKYP